MYPEEEVAAVECTDAWLTNPLNESAQCWGAAIKAGDGTKCTAGFVSGKAHFKNKFCAACRDCVDVPAWRTRALTEELKAHCVSNSLSAGFWKRAPADLGGGEFRLVNNTITCNGPWLVIFREEPPDLPWQPIPPDWLDADVIRMSVAKGTLVPIFELSHFNARRPMRVTKAAGGNSAAPAPSSPELPKRQRRAVQSAFPMPSAQETQAMLKPLGAPVSVAGVAMACGQGGVGGPSCEEAAFANAVAMPVAMVVPRTLNHEPMGPHCAQVNAPKLDPIGPVAQPAAPPDGGQRNGSTVFSFAGDCFNHVSWSMRNGSQATTASDTTPPDSRSTGSGGASPGAGSSGGSSSPVWATDAEAKANLTLPAELQQSMALDARGGGQGGGYSNFGAFACSSGLGAGVFGGGVVPGQAAAQATVMQQQAVAAQAVQQAAAAQQLAAAQQVAAQHTQHAPASNARETSQGLPTALLGGGLAPNAPLLLAKLRSAMVNAREVSSMLLNSAPAGVVDESRRIGLEQMAERYAHDVRQLEVWMFENAAAPSAAMQRAGGGGMASAMGAGAMGAAPMATAFATPAVSSPAPAIAVPSMMQQSVASASYGMALGAPQNFRQGGPNPAAAPAAPPMAVPVSPIGAVPLQNVQGRAPPIAAAMPINSQQIGGQMGGGQMGGMQAQMGNNAIAAAYVPAQPMACSQAPVNARQPQPRVQEAFMPTSFAGMMGGPAPPLPTPASSQQHAVAVGACGAIGDDPSMREAVLAARMGLEVSVGDEGVVDTTDGVADEAVDAWCNNFCTFDNVVSSQPPSSLSPTSDQLVSRIFGNPNAPAGSVEATGIAQRAANTMASLPPSPPQTPASPPQPPSHAPKAAAALELHSPYPMSAMLIGVALAVAASNAHISLTTATPDPQANGEVRQGLRMENGSAGTGLSSGALAGGLSWTPAWSKSVPMALDVPPSAILTPFMLLLLLVTALPLGSYQARRAKASVIWRFVCILMPIVFVVDDFLRTPEQVEARLNKWASDVRLPLESTLIWTGIGVIHAGVAGVDAVRILHVCSWILLFRQVHLAVVTGDPWRPTLGFSTCLFPLWGGFCASKRLAFAPETPPA